MSKAEDEILIGKSEDVKEILGTPPEWPLRWGNTILLLVFGTGLIFTWLVHYPDKIHAKVVITTVIPPAPIIARSDGRIARLARANEIVRANDVVCVLDNPARYEDVFKVSEQLNAAGANIEEISASTFPTHLSLGEFQQEYNNFIAALNRRTFYGTHLPLEKEIASLNLQITKNRQLYNLQLKQIDIYERQVKLVEGDYDRNKKLFEQRVIAATDLEVKEQALLKAQSDLETARLAATNVQIQLAELEKQLSGKTIENAEEKNDLSISLRESHQKLKSAIAIWETKYVLRSPIDGMVSFFEYWSDNQFVKVGDEVMTIVPEGRNELIGKVKMPLQNSGKAAIGQRVNIRLNNYPYEEYGMIEGVVKDISLVPQKDLYAIDVELTRGMITTYNKQLVFHQELQGDAEIITEDLRLLERMFYGIRKLVVN